MVLAGLSCRDACRRAEDGPALPGQRGARPGPPGDVPGGPLPGSEPEPAGDRRGRDQRRRARAAPEHGPPLSAGLCLLPSARGGPARCRRLADPPGRARPAGRQCGPAQPGGAVVTRLRELPRSVRWTLPLALLGLAVTVPFSAPDGTGMQWDELVLGSVAFVAAVAVFRTVQTMDRAAARPWQPLGFAALLFMTAQWLEAVCPGPEFDGFGIDKVFLLVGATMPLVTCALLALRVTRTRWPALLVDGAVTTAAVLVITEVLRTPLVNPVGAPQDLRSLVLTYGGYAAVMLGGAGTLCTVSTAASRRSATIMIGAVAAQAAAAWFEAMAIVAPTPLWTAASDVAVALGMQALVFAVSAAPRRCDERTARAAAPVASRIGILLVFASLLGLPLAIGLSLAGGQALSPGTQVGCGVIFCLMALRLLPRVPGGGRGDR